MCDTARNRVLVNSFALYLIGQSVSTLKRILWSQKNLILLIKCTEWTEHTAESHAFIMTNLLDLSAPVMSGSKGHC